MLTYPNPVIVDNNDTNKISWDCVFTPRVIGRKLNAFIFFSSIEGFILLPAHFH